MKYNYLKDLILKPENPLDSSYRIKRRLENKDVYSH